MNRRALWWVAKALEGVGMIVVLVGVFISMNLGFEDQGNLFRACKRWFGESPATYRARFSGGAERTARSS